MSNTYSNLTVENRIYEKALRQAIIAKQAHLTDYLKDLQVEAKCVKEELKSLKEQLEDLGKNQIDMFGG